MVKWSCTNTKIKLMMTLIFGRMVVHKEKKNERRSHIFVECSFANEINKSMATLNFSQMVVH